MLIAFSGAQCSGKTTLINLLKENNKLKNFKITEKEIRNLANKGFEINENGDNQTQLQVMNIHLNNILSKENKILDRCILDCFCYTQYLYEEGKIERFIYEIIEKVFINTIYSKYSIIFYTKPDFEFIEDGVRSNKNDFRNKMDEIFEKIIKEYNVPVVRLKGSTDERMKMVNEILEERGAYKC